MQPGLPNITGQCSGEAYEDWYSGAFQMLKSIGGNTGGGTDALVTFDASRCNAIYGNADTVQPAAVKLLFIIKY